MEKAEILIRGKDETAQAWASVQQNASAAIERINGLLPGLAAGLTAAGMISFAKHALDSADQLNKMSQRTGIAVEDLSALKFAADQADVRIEGLALGIKKLSVSAMEATDKHSQMAGTFRTIGVSATDFNGKIRPTQELLLSMADRFSKMEDGAQKTALAVKVFGKTGDELIPFLNMGRDGIAGLTAEAQRLGLVMSADAAQAAERVNDNLKVLKTGSEALAISLMQQLAPSLVRITDAMRESLKEHGTLYALWIGMGGVAAEALGLGMREAAEKARDLTIQLQQLTDKQREYNAQLAKDPSDKKLQGWIKGAQAQIDAKQAELKIVQAEVDAENARRDKVKKAVVDMEQRAKDQASVEAFIANLRKEAHAISDSKEAQIKLAAAQAAGKIQTADLANKLIVEAAAWAKKITALQKTKLETEALMRLDKEQKDATDKAKDSAIAHAQAMELDAKQWRMNNDERRIAKTLSELVATGMSEESREYQNLEAKLNAASGALERTNELKARRDARDQGLKTLQDEIAAIQFETVTLRLNNDERARAQMLRTMSQNGVNVLSDPQAAEAMDRYEEAMAALGRERRKQDMENQKNALDQKTAALVMSLGTQQEIEQIHFDQENKLLDDAHANGLFKDKAYYDAKERLLKRHSAAVLANKNQETARLQNLVNLSGQGELKSMAEIAGLGVTLMQSKSRRMFEIGKVFALAQATINTAHAVTSALAVQPFPVGLALAAVAAAAGAVQIQAIKSQNFNGGGAAAGTIGTFSASPSTGLPESQASSSFEQVAPAQSQQAAPRRDVFFHVEIVGEGLMSTDQVRSLIKQINEANSDGIKIIVN